MHRYRIEIKKLIKLATPVLVASVAQTGMGFVDTVMAGGVSALDMAAVSIAASIWFPTIIFGTGVLMALVPVIAQLSGARKLEQIPFQIQQGLLAALLLLIPTILVLMQTNTILEFMDVDPELSAMTNGYIHTMLFAAPAFLLFQALRSFTDGMSDTRISMIIGFCGLVLNVPVNYIFVYGKFGAPALGGVGCGVATAIVYWSMFAMLLFYIVTSKRLAHVPIFAQFYRPNVKELIGFFRLGLPLATAIFCEVSLFSVVSIIIAPLGAQIVASHQVALNYSSLIFMIPMSIAAAVCIRIGNFIGEEKPLDAIVAAKTALFLGFTTALVTATFTVLFAQHISELYTHDVDVQNLAVGLLFLAAIYQCTDSIQVICGGVLRGYKDMKAILVRTLVSYWVFGLPSGYILGMTDWIVPHMGAFGFWIGFVVGLSVSAILLGLRLKEIFKRQLAMNISA
ncbi:MATE family efflux transporter [Vibrio sp. WJH972]